MTIDNELFCTAFNSHSQFISGSVQEVALAIKKSFLSDGPDDILVFNNDNGTIVELELQGSLDDVFARYQVKPLPVLTITEPVRKPGRPKLGVVGHEVTLLPRHWEWLRSQPGGASVALRKLVDQGRRDNREVDQTRSSRHAASAFMNVIAGNMEGFEEANRALYANDARRFNFEIELWPEDIKAYINTLATNAFTTISN